MAGIYGPRHKLEVDVAASPILAYICGGRSKRIISLEDWFAKLIAFVGDRDVWRRHKLFASPSDAFRDRFAYALRCVDEEQNMIEEESARHDLAFSKSILGSILTLLCDVFDARGGAVMVMVKLMEGSEVSNITQRKPAGILDNVLTRSRLCDAA